MNKNFRNIRQFSYSGFLLSLGIFLTGATFYQVNNGASTDITEHATCKTVTNNHASGKAVFVPTATSTEWTQFYTNPPAGVTAVDCPSGFVFNATISANTTNYNVKSAAIAAGWDQVEPLIATVTINSGITVYSTSTATPAFSSGSTFPVGSSLAIINNGSIVGKSGNGGTGGNGGSGSGYFTCENPTAGQAGGPALSISMATSVTNNGAIYGGGGGGGGGGSATHSVYQAPLLTTYCVSGGGGGGGRSYAGATGGSPGTTANCTIKSVGGTGGNGTNSTAGSGGSGSGSGSVLGGAGGAGGGYGSAGSSGNSGTGSCATAGAAGGAGGAAVNGNANITWVATGTRTGAINN